MKKRQKLLRQISFRLYDNPRDQKIYDFLQGSVQNQSEYIRSLIEKEMQRSSQVTEDRNFAVTSENKLSESNEKPKRSFSGGFSGFRA